MEKYDFSGWATRNNLKCSDGRVIIKDAFKDCDGLTVPLVWNHRHNEPFNILGHALLENREEGVYSYCTFNDTDSGRQAKLLVEHGDISALSIYANQLRQQGSNVVHGSIREVSLVLAGANPGAFIDSVMQHSDDADGEAIIYTGEELAMFHSEEVKEPEKTEESKETMENESDSISHAEEDAEETENFSTEETVADVFNSFTDKQKEVVYAMIGEALKEDTENTTAETT